MSRKVAWGKTLEQLSHDVFDAFRWMLTVGLTRYVALQTGSAAFLYVSYALSLMLLAFLMSIFLLRGDMTIFRTETAVARMANMLLNLLVCAGAFAACLWLTFILVDDFVTFQESL